MKVYDSETEIALKQVGDELGRPLTEKEREELIEIWKSNDEVLKFQKLFDDMTKDLVSPQSIEDILSDRSNY